MSDTPSESDRRAPFEAVVELDEPLTISEEDMELLVDVVRRALESARRRDPEPPGRCQPGRLNPASDRFGNS